MNVRVLKPNERMKILAEQRCRCSGTNPGCSPNYVGSWCGRRVDAEDGLCEMCRRDCMPPASANPGPNSHWSRVLTLDEVVQRDAHMDID